MIPPKLQRHSTPPMPRAPAEQIQTHDEPLRRPPTGTACRTARPLQTTAATAGSHGEGRHAITAVTVHPLSHPRPRGGYGLWGWRADARPFTRGRAGGREGLGRSRLWAMGYGLWGWYADARPLTRAVAWAGGQVFGRTPEARAYEAPRLASARSVRQPYSLQPIAYSLPGLWGWPVGGRSAGGPPYHLMARRPAALKGQHIPAQGSALGKPAPPQSRAPCRGATYGRAVESAGRGPVRSRGGGL
jgi:hypothetical protein